MQLIDGKKTADECLEALRPRIARLVENGITPHLDVVLVGEDPASVAYVRMKDKTCARFGIGSKVHRLPASTSQEELLRLIQSLNDDPCTHGILVQSPPPPHINEQEIVGAMDPAKDVDGFHPVNVARLAMEDPRAFVPCTPLGCQKLLIAHGIPTAGAEVVVVGRSMIVGKPMALLLMAKGPGGDATVTVAHSRSGNLPEITRRADIVIAAIGRPFFLGAEHIKEGAVVIDVGINRVDDPESERGYRLVGDVDYEAVAPKCRAITPVPGGVGPMTIAMLLQNTVTACERIHSMA